ncbi:MAG: rRNA cytosine-C5-methyltransferase [Bacteroidaceae bacterium]|nr:rRNA cytosine-C5-methyltransferase [Bacteroidaceae bacterium]
MKLPQVFIDQTKKNIGAASFEKLAAALQQETPISIRFNEAKITKETYSEKYLPVNWAKTGAYIPLRPTFTFDPLFHAGCYYVQEAASMFLEQAINQYVPSDCIALDLCAAPGGKSTHLISLLSSNSLLVSNEVVRVRSRILAENMIKWGRPNVVVTNNDPADFKALPSFFDLIVADVPCSGEGMFRKDPASIAEWSAENVAICAQRQRRILTDVWDSLKPGGLLIYSTCTYNLAENEENIAWLMEQFSAEPLLLTIPDSWNVTGNLVDAAIPVYHFFPHKTAGEGFFLAVLRKPFAAVAEQHLSPRKRADKRAKKNAMREKQEACPAEIANWLQAPASYLLTNQMGRVTAFPRCHSSLLEQLKALRILHAGIELATIKGKSLIPAHALAMSTQLSPTAFARVELTFSQALSYLRKESFAVSDTAPKGYLLLTFNGIPLGFSKNIGNRVNNLYPNEWRIRSGYTPNEIRCLLSK